MYIKRSRGNILIVALLLIVVVSGFVGAALNATNNSARLTDRSRDYAAAQAAAEGALEYGFAIWKRRILDQNRAITTNEANANLGQPGFPGFTYASTAERGPLRIDALDEYGAPIATPKPITIDLVTYPGWRGRTYSYQARAKMQQNPASYDFRVGIKRGFQYSEVPLFQTMFFFEDDIEFYKPAQMIISGLVHTNSWAYTSGQATVPLTFLDKMSYVKGYSHSYDPPFANMWSGWSPNATTSPIYPDGQAAQVRQVARFEPLGNEPASVLNTTDVNPNNDSMRELIEPPNGNYADPVELAERRLYNKAGIIVMINGPSVTVSTQNGTTLNSARTSEVISAVAGRTKIFDQREGKNVDVATVDVAKLTDTLKKGGSNNFNGVLYIHDTTPSTVLNSDPKAIRLVNGGVLPDNGLTVVSENPVYIQGDYNTGTTSSSTTVPSNDGGNPSNTDAPTVAGYTRKPAAVIGDAVMFLSNNWSDLNSALPVVARAATHTTYNTAIVSGFMPSGYQPPVGAQYGYSGGANNFPRFLENWTDNSCTYFGSMVELFQSKTFTGRWDTGVIFRPPLRRWNFDENYRQNPPPGSLDAVVWSRGTWAKY